MPSRVAAFVSMLSVPTPARTMALQPMVALQHVGRDLHAAAADGAVELAKRRAQRVALQAGADFVLNSLGGGQQVETFLGQRIQHDHFRHDCSRCENPTIQQDLDGRGIIKNVRPRVSSTCSAPSAAGDGGRRELAPCRGESPGWRRGLPQPSSTSWPISSSTISMAASVAITSNSSMVPKCASVARSCPTVPVGRRPT